MALICVPLMLFVRPCYESRGAEKDEDKVAEEQEGQSAGELAEQKIIDSETGAKQTSIQALAESSNLIQDASGGHNTKNIKLSIVGGTHTLGILLACSFALLGDEPESIDEKTPENKDFIPNVTPNIKSSINLLGSNINSTVSNNGGNIATK